MQQTELRVCEVCKYLDWDYSVKECKFCSTCNAYICLDDLPKLRRRAKAMVMKKLKLGYA
jgi:hypothetical protein